MPDVQLTDIIFLRREFYGNSGFLLKKSGSHGPTKFFGPEKITDFFFAH